MLMRRMKMPIRYVARLSFWPRTRLVMSGRHCQSTHGAEAGFTLVEMLVVITIIGLIMGLVGPRVLSYLSDSKVKTAKIQIQGFSSALDLFYLDNGRYPTSSEGLGALTQKPSGATAWNGPYLNGGSVPNDPWGRPYAYKVPGSNGPYEVVSLGPDGQSDLTVAGNISGAQQ
jgi:general secretion pathway protein G